MRLKLTNENSKQHFGLPKDKVIEAYKTGTLKSKLALEQIGEQFFFEVPDEIPAPNPSPVTASIPDESVKEIQNAKTDLTLLDLQLQKALKEKNFADLEAFMSYKEQTEKALASKIKEQGERENKLKNDLSAFEAEKTLCQETMKQALAAGEKNEKVKKALEEQITGQHKKDMAVMQFARATYFQNFDALCQKIYNARTGKDCVGLRENSKGKMVDEPVVIDVNFQEELLDLLKPILTTLKKSPSFTEENEYKTEGEGEGEETESEETPENNN